MPFLKRKRVLAAKIEATVGTVETLAAADAAFNIYDPMVQVATEMEDRQGQGGFGYLSSVPAGRQGTVTFRTNLEWDGTLTEPLWADTFFPACGWVKTGQVYTPRAEAPGTNVKTLTIAVYEAEPTGSNATRKMLSGCMGSFTVNLPTGRLGFIEWEFQGVWQPVASVAMLNPTYPTVRGMRYAGGLAEWNGENMCVESAVIASGNNVIMRECPTTAAGFISAFITDRKPIVTINPEAVTVATQDRWAAWLAESEHALELDVSGPTTSVLSFDAPRAQILNNQEGDRNGMVTDDIEMQCNKNGATHDEELSITFTAAV